VSVSRIVYIFSSDAFPQRPRRSRLISTGPLPRSRLTLSLAKARRCYSSRRKMFFAGADSLRVSLKCWLASLTRVSIGRRAAVSGWYALSVLFVLLLRAECVSVPTGFRVDIGRYGL